MTGQQFYQDAPVYDTANEKIGTLQAYDPQAGYLVVQKGFLFHKDRYIPANAVQNTDADGAIYLNLHKDDLQDERYASPPAGGMATDNSYAQRTTVAETTETTTRARETPQPARRQNQATAQTGDVNVPVYEEELVAGKRQEQIGDVRLHKDVVTEQETVPVTLRREEVTVERIPVSGQANQADAKNAFKNEDIDVPVMGEEAVVGKQVHETEEVRLHKQGVTEQEQVSDTVRKERVVVDGADNTGRQ